MTQHKNRERKSDDIKANCAQLFASNREREIHFTPGWQEQTYILGNILEKILTNSKIRRRSIHPKIFEIKGKKPRAIYRKRTKKMKWNKMTDV